MLSPHFSEEELRCKCCGAVVVDGRLIQLLEKIRSLVDAPVVVTSGYRCPRHNAETPESSPTSYHVLGMAADIKQFKYSNGVFHTMIRRAWSDGGLPELGGLGLYEGRVHVDVFRAPDGHLREWRG